MTAPTLLVVQHEPGTGPGWWGTWLTEAGLDLDIHHGYLDADMPGPGGYDGLLVLGGAMGPSEDQACPWLPGVRRLLADAVAADLPTFGICLGAELMTVACGGHVRRGPAGPELGVCEIELTAAAAADPVLGVLPSRCRVLQWHWEEMDALPPGAVTLATSPAYRHQAFRLGDSAWGVQGHPEVTAEIAAVWSGEDGPLLRDAGRDPDELVAEVAAATEELVATWRPVAEEFAGVVQRRSAKVAARPA